MDYLKFVEELFKRGVISEEIYLKTIKEKKEVIKCTQCQGLNKKERV